MGETILRGESQSTGRQPCCIAIFNLQKCMATDLWSGLGLCNVVSPPNHLQTDTALTLSVYLPYLLSGLRSDRSDSSLWLGEKFS